jgi:hypothetical protein
MRKARPRKACQMLGGWPARVVRAFWRLAGGVVPLTGRGVYAPLKTSQQILAPEPHLRNQH